MKKVLVLMLLGSSLLFGSASIISGTKQAVTFTSEPDNANVIIDGVNRGKTPLTVVLKKNKYDTAMIKKDGYRTKIVPIQKSFDGVAMLDILWDLSTTDLTTGAVFEYAPNSYYVELKKQESN